MRRPGIASVLAAIILAPLLLACGGATGPAERGEADIDLAGPVEVTLWHTQTQALAKALQDMVDEFNRTNDKQITVKLEFQGNYTQLYQKNIAAIQAGTLPDAAVAYESFVADYMKANVVVDLDPYVRGKHGLSKESQDDIYKPYFDTNRFPQFGNKLLSFPFTKSLLVMYQSDDILKELGAQTPQTWADFERVARDAKKVAADGKVTRWGWAVPVSASTFNGWVLSRGGRLMSEDNKSVAWDGREGLESLKLLQRGFQDGWAYQPKGFDYQNDFGAGRVAFVQESSTGRPFFRSSMTRPMNWGIVSIPQTDPSRARTVQYGANIAIFKTTPEKQLASWLFVKWFSDSAQTAKWAIASSYMPVRKSSSNDGALKEAWTKDPQGKQAFDLIGTSIAEPNVRGQQDIRTVIEDMITKVITAKATPEDAIREAGTKANQILKDNQ
jgi:ABC-type glycerol-3-phosphate transport system substrate-binding protein